MRDDILTIGMGFGDEGKGSFIQYIAKNNPEVNYFEKYNGGCHGRHCIIKDRKKYVFSHLSPSILYGKTTVLSNNFVIEPFSLINEIEEISKVSGISKEYILEHLYIDKKCVCATPFHKAFNVIQEETKSGRGSVGTGISIAGKHHHKGITLFADSFSNATEILHNQKEYFINLCQEQGLNYESLYNIDIEKYAQETEHILDGFHIINTETLHTGNEKFVYESSQGILLDKNYGFYPNTTLLDTSADSRMDVNNRIGFIRSIYTRHGKGLFPTEDVFDIQDISQQEGKYSGKIRFGYFDCVLLRYALKCTNVNELYISHMDYLKRIDNPKICIAYAYNGEVDEDFKNLFDFVIMNDKNKRKVYIENIKEHNNKLTSYLSKVTPVYKALNFNDKGFYSKVEEYLKIIETECKTSVSVFSFGADVMDKVRR